MIEKFVSSHPKTVTILIISFVLLSFFTFLFGIFSFLSILLPSFVSIIVRYLGNLMILILQIGYNLWIYSAAEAIV